MAELQPGASSPGNAPAVTRQARLGLPKPESPRPRIDSTRNAAIATAVAIGVIIAIQLSFYRTDLAEWDWLLVTGCLTFIGGLWLARSQPDRFDAMLTRLKHREALQRSGSPISKDDLARIKAELELGTQKMQWWTGVAFTIAVTVAWVVVLIAERRETVLLLVEAAMALLAGRLVGRFLGSSRLSSVLERHGVTVRAVAGHVDGAAGLRPLGSYFFYQALVLALPATFLMLWSLLLIIPSWEQRYGPWRGPYLGLLSIAISLEILGFVAPLWRTHETMTRQKRVELVHADTAIAPRIAAARGKLAQELDPAKRAALHDLIDDLTAAYRELEAMPTWPVDRTLVRRVTIGNLALILPLVTQIIAAAADWKKL